MVLDVLSDPLRGAEPFPLTPNPEDPDPSRLHAGVARAVAAGCSPAEYDDTVPGPPHELLETADESQWSRTLGVEVI